MSSFLTQCPHCLTSFRVTDAQLEAADGLVRCGACLGIFSAAANRITLKQTPEEAAAATPPEVALDDDADTDEAFDSEDAFAAEEPAAEEFIPAVDEDEFAAETPEAPPVEFVLPHTFADDEELEAEPLSVARDEPVALANVAEESEPDLRDQEDFDIPLGDLNLYDEDSFEEELHEDDEDDEDDDEYLEELVDDTDEEFADELDHEDEADETEDEEALLATASEAFGIANRHERDDQDDDEYDARARIAADKTELRRHLAQLEDDEALEPLDDEDLDFDDDPVLLDTAPRRSWPVTTALFLANVLLAAVLALQYADTNIERLSRSASFVPFRPYVCRIVDCPPPERSQLDLLVSEQLLVRSHPQYAQALEVNLVFRNDAAEAQPFPAIELGFHDTSNRLLANRLFMPTEYLPNELKTSEMPARSSLQVLIEMVDPGSEAVNYTLVFREP